jgi:hypothetical protein
MTENRLRFIKGVLYRLKRSYGSQADIYYRPAGTWNITTGIQTINITKYTVKRAVLLPTKASRDSIFSNISITANKNFTYGGVFEVGERAILLDRADLPKGFVLKLEECYIIIAKRRYEIVEIEELDNSAGYYVKIKELKGAQLSQIIDVELSNSINIESSMEAET